MTKLTPKLALTLAALVATASLATANGRPAGTSSINFRQGNDAEIAAGMTYGLVISKDHGATWHWVCEDAIKYAGVYDPIYAYTSTGALFATTFDGSLVNRDDCAFDATVFGTKFVSTISQGASGAVFMALAQPRNTTTGDPGDAKIYRSDDNGMTFAVSANPGQLNDWWDSIMVAPSDPQRVYLTGYRLGSGGRTQLLFRSNDGGATYAPMGLTGITFTNDSTIDVVGVDKTNPDIVYAQVDFQTVGVLGDAIFKSTDGGTSWTKIFGKASALSFLARGDGELVAASQTEGLFRAPPGSTTFTAVVNAPHVNCLAENAAGEVWACTQNFGAPGVPSDNAGIMKSTDLATWTPVMRYQDLAGPLECAVGTIQHDTCEVKNWCVLKAQLGITSDPTCCPVDGASPTCGVGGDVSGGDGGGGGGGKGCCDTGGNGAQTGLLASLFIGSLLVRKRRRT